jgi:hypothetical protein
MKVIRCLIIYDNVEDYDVLSKYIPPSGSHILITTRYKWMAYRAPGLVLAYELHTFDATQSLELFTHLRQILDNRARSEKELDATRGEHGLEFTRVTVGLTRGSGITIPVRGRRVIYPTGTG